MSLTMIRSQHLRTELLDANFVLIVISSQVEIGHKIIKKKNIARDIDISQFGNQSGIQQMITSLEVFSV